MNSTPGKRTDIKNFVLETSTEQESLERGRMLVRQADAGRSLSEEHAASFEDPAELVKLLMATRLDVFRAVTAEPASISGLEQRLYRDRSAAKRDGDQLARAGMVLIESRVLPGHGRLKEVRSATRSFRLEAVLTYPQETRDCLAMATHAVASLRTASSGRVSSRDREGSSCKDKRVRLKARWHREEAVAPSSNSDTSRTPSVRKDEQLSDSRP